MNIALAVIVDTIAVTVVFVALVRVVTTPAHLWTHGRLSQTAWVIAVLLFIVGDRGVYLPIAAAIAIWHTRKLNAHPPQAPSPLPFADGNPDRTDRNTGPGANGERHPS